MTNEKSKEDKSIEDLTPEDLKEVKIQFAPGCFDDFDGTQEELDGLISEITRLIRSGELLEQSEPIDMDELMDEDPDIAEKLINNISNLDNKRTLQ